MALESNNSSVTAINATQLYSRDDLRYFLLVFELALLQSISFLGIVGNTIIIIVLRGRGKRKGCSKIWFTSMALSDLVYSLVGLVSGTLNIFRTYGQWLDETSHIFSICFLDAIEKTALGMGATIASAVAIEGCIAVLFPLKAARIITTARVKIVLSFLVLYVFCVCSPLLLACHIDRIGDSTWNTSQFCHRYFDWFNSQDMMKIKILVPHLVGTVNALIILVCHLTIAVQLTDHVRNRHTLPIRKLTSGMKVVKKHLLVYVSYVWVLAFLLMRSSFLLTDPWQSVFSLLLRAAVSWKIVIFLIMSRQFSSAFKKQFAIN